MEATNWLKQTPDKPLFADFLWSRPENRRQAGRLLIIGGNSHGFSAPMTAFNAAIAAGAGAVRVVLPDKLIKPLGSSFSEAEFAPSTPSGSFSRKALDAIIENAKWADGVLLAGDFGRNSETAILLGLFLEKFDGQVALAQDGLDYFLNVNSPLLNRPSTLSVINMGKLQKLGKNNLPDPPIRHAMHLLELIKLLEVWHTNIMTRHAGQFVVASGGKISTTPQETEAQWQIDLAAYAAVWWIQNSAKNFEAFTTAVYEFVNLKSSRS